MPLQHYTLSPTYKYFFTRLTLPSWTFWVTVKVFPVSRGTVQLTGSGERMSICSGDFTRVGSGGDLTNAGSTSGSSLFGCWSESCSSSPGAAPSVARIMSTFQTHMCCRCTSMMLCTRTHTRTHTHTKAVYFSFQ